MACVNLKVAFAKDRQLTITSYQYRLEDSMSNWTHVAAVFRVDYLGFISEKPDMDKIFGKECLFDAPRSIRDDAFDNPDDYLPMGSEGTLQKSVWENPDKSCIAAYTVSVFGDLRDHESVDDIGEWFKRICSKDVMLKQAVCTASNELNGSKTFTLLGKDVDDNPVIEKTDL